MIAVGRPCQPLLERGKSFERVGLQAPEIGIHGLILKAVVQLKQESLSRESLDSQARSSWVPVFAAGPHPAEQTRTCGW
jgi:hypothetical protein